MSDNASAKKTNPAKLTLAALAAAGAIGMVAFQYYRVPDYGLGIGEEIRRASKVIETDDGRRLLWATGPFDEEKGEWFDVTAAPIEPSEYQLGIGKDTIAAIDDPLFVPIGEAEALRETHFIDDDTEVIGFVHNGQAKAYPIRIMNRHELVNDTVGGKPVTVGW